MSWDAFSGLNFVIRWPPADNDIDEILMKIPRYVFRNIIPLKRGHAGAWFWIRTSDRWFGTLGLGRHHWLFTPIFGRSWKEAVHTGWASSSASITSGHRLGVRPQQKCLSTCQLQSQDAKPGCTEQVYAQGMRAWPSDLFWYILTTYLRTSQHRGKSGLLLAENRIDRTW